MVSLQTLLDCTPTMQSFKSYISNVCDYITLIFICLYDFTEINVQNRYAEHDVQYPVSQFLPALMKSNTNKYFVILSFSFIHVKS